MRSFANIVAILFCVAAFACGKDDNILVKEQTNIVSYLDRILTGDDSYDQPGRVYRVVGNAGRDGYEAAAKAETGDSVSFYFSAHLLNTSADINEQPLFFTNKPQLIRAMQARGLTGRWSSEPRKIKLGTSPLSQGLRQGITGAREKDSLILFMTSDMGYGKEEMFNLPENSSLVFFIELESVKKP